MDRHTSLTVYHATQDCRQSLNQYREYTKLNYDVKGETRTTSDEWVDNRIADFNLWASGIGALATNRASLDARLEARPEIRSMVIDLLQLLNLLIKDCIEFAQASVTGDNQDILSLDTIHRSTSQLSLTKSSSGSSLDSDSSDISSDVGRLAQAKHRVDDVLDQLTRITFAIRQSSTHARLQKADRSKNNRDDDDLKRLETHLRMIILASRLPLHDILTLSDKIYDIELTEIESRLIQCNLKRRHRFLYQQAHSKRLAVGPRRAIFEPPGFIATKELPKQAQSISTQESNPQEEATSSVVNQFLDKEMDDSELSLRTATTATALTTQEQIHQRALQSEQSATRISVTVGKVAYPPAPDTGDQRVFKCPCCCQTLPVIYTERSRWKKHLAEDLAPYTCILPRCPRPEDIYITREAWQSHLQNEHKIHEYWECLSCNEAPIYEDKQQFTIHLLHDHQDTILPDQIPTLVSDLGYSIPVDINSCPLCQYSEVGTIDLDRNTLLDHIAEHIHDFSLRALPWPADDKDNTPNQEARAKSYDWILAYNVQEAMIEHNYAEPSNFDNNAYQQWFQSWISRIRQPDTFHSITGENDIRHSNYFDNNQYFDDKSSTDDSVDTSRDYQKLLVSENVSLYWNVPFARNPDFRGREIILEALEDNILNAGSPFQIVLFGQPGCGKTEIVKELAYRVFTNSPEHAIFWIDGTAVSSIFQDLMEISKQLGISSEDDSLGSAGGRVWQHLSEGTIGPWLLIFDNVDSIAWRLYTTKVQDFMSKKSEGNPPRNLKYHLPVRDRSCIIFNTRQRNFSQLLPKRHMLVEVPALEAEDIQSPRLSFAGHITRGIEPIRRVRALFDSTSDSPKDLVFKKGDIIDVMEYQHNGWWKGSLGGLTGGFPMNFMEPAEHAGQLTSHSSYPSAPIQTLSIPAVTETPIQISWSDATVLGLNLFSPAEFPQAEIIFIHGLGGDPLRTWMFDTIFWPKDLLQDDLDDCNIWTYGYGDDNLFFSTGDRTLAFLADLQASVANIPLIFVAHGFGGLIVKHTLCSARASSDLERRRIYNATTAVIFFGTSHETEYYKGDDILRRMTAFQTSFSPIKATFDWIPTLNTMFIELLSTSNISILNFEEEDQLDIGSKPTLESRVISAKRPLFHQTGYGIPIVDDNTAISTPKSQLNPTADIFVPKADSNHDNICMDIILPTTHTKMCKFASKSEPGYRYVLLILKQYLRKTADIQQVLHETTLAHEESQRPTTKLVFGVDLGILCAQERLLVPSVVSECIRAIELYGMDTEGIYYFPGNALLIDKLQALFDDGSSHIDLQNPSQWHQDIYSVAGLLKQFFTKLPNPLLPREQNEAFMYAARHKRNERRRKALSKEIESLASANWHTLRAIVLHLRKIVDHSRILSNTIERLTRVWVPILLGRTVHTSELDKTFQMRALSSIIDHAHSIFPEG